MIRCKVCDREECRRSARPPAAVVAAVRRLATVNSRTAGPDPEDVRAFEDYDRAERAATADCERHRKDWRAEALTERRMREDAERLLTAAHEHLRAIARAVGAKAGPGSQDVEGVEARTYRDAVRRVDALAAWRDDLADELRKVVTYADQRAAGGQMTGPSSAGRLASAGPAALAVYREYLARLDGAKEPTDD